MLHSMLVDYTFDYTVDYMSAFVLIILCGNIEFRD